MIKGSKNEADTNYTVVTIGENVTLKGWAGVFIRQYNANNNSEASTSAHGVVVNFYGKITAPAAANHTVSEGAIYINGNIHDSVNCPVINIYDTAVITNNIGAGIYAAGYAKWNIYGGSITAAASGIELRAGELNVTGGTIKSTATSTTSAKNGNGPTTSGAGIAVIQHSTMLPITVNISGGTITGNTAFYQNNTQENNSEAIAKISLNIKGGTFTGAKGIYSENISHFITGGTFSVDPTSYGDTVTDYVALGYVVTKTADNYTVSKAATTTAGTNEAVADTAVTVSGNTATVTELVIDDNSEDKTAVIDLSNTGTTINTAALTPEQIKDIEDNANGVKIIFSNNFAITFDAAAIAQANDKIGNSGDPVTLSIKTIKATDSKLTSAQSTALKTLATDDTKLAVIDISFMCGDKNLGSSFGTGSAIVTVPYKAQAANSEVALLYLATDGKATNTDAKYSNGMFTFSTPHFSQYVITDKSAAIPPTGDESAVILWTAMACASIMLAFIAVNKKKKYEAE